MNEEGLRGSLHEAASAEPAVGDAFARFEVARRRMNVARGVVLVVVGIAVAMSFAFVFPNPFTSGRPANFQEGGPFDPQDRFVNLYQDRIVRYEVRYPTDWGVRGSPGATAVFAEKHADAFPRYVVRDPETGFETPAVSFIRVTPLPAGCKGAGTSRACRQPDPEAFADAGASVEVLAGGKVAGRDVDAYLVRIPGSTDVDALSRGHVIPCVSCELVSYWVEWNNRWTIRVDAIAPDEDALGELIPDADSFMSSLTDFVERPFD